MTFNIRTETLEDDFIISEIVRTVFGPGRFAKTAYRLRENPDNKTLFGLVTENHLKKIVATVRVTRFDQYDNHAILGPIAVLPDLRNIGLGIALMKEAEKKSLDYGIKKIILIGDPKYYNRLGYTNEGTDFIHFSSPTIKSRILKKDLVDFVN